MSPDDPERIGLLLFGLAIIVFRRELSAMYAKVAKRFFNWEPAIDMATMATIYLVGGVILVLAAVVALLMR